MRKEQELKRQYKEEDKLEKIKFKHEQENKIWAENIYNQSVNLARFIEGLSAAEYDEFIKNEIRKIQIFEAQEIDKRNAVNKIRQKGTFREFSGDQQVALLVAHMLCFLPAGVAYMLHDYSFADGTTFQDAAMIAGGLMGGGMVGFMACVLDSTIIEKSGIINKLRKLRIKMLEKKARKARQKIINQKAVYKNIIADEELQDGEAHKAVRKILDETEYTC